ncbi:MAG: hypothetical protein GKC10_06210 [Methanosarcinales archaeon]|nr:hypothetical protein [Methanosarcinales archaeon]
MEWQTLLAREIRRKTIHITGLSVPIGLVLLGQMITAALIATAMAVAIVLETMRLRGQIRLPEVRDSEKDRVAGYVYFIFGALLTVLLFRPAIALTAMLMLSLGDAASGIIGSVLRGSNVRDQSSLPGARRRIKPLPVVLGMFLVCLALGYLSSALTLLPFAVYLAGALGATLADSVPVFLRGSVVDDNFTIPIYASLFMTLASLI